MTDRPPLVGYPGNCSICGHRGRFVGRLQDTRNFLPMRGMRRHPSLARAARGCHPFLSRATIKEPVRSVRVLDRSGNLVVRHVLRAVDGDRAGGRFATCRRATCSPVSITSTSLRNCP